MAKVKYRSRTHMLLLYPDNEQHAEAIEKIKQSYDYAMCLHDRDCWTAEDEKKDPAKVAGALKKKHYHVVLRFKNDTWSSAIIKDLGIEHNYIEDVKRFDNALKYLIHYDDIDKVQYSVDEVKGNLKTRLIEAINKGMESEGERVTDLINYIKIQDEYITITDFAVYCASNGYWAEFRRSASILLKIIDEQNTLQMRRKENGSR